ncbi:MAG: porin, partial [Gammaproteobacteria bacterium]|nr:porin [Gammaproteobacteria bacterium]
MAANTPSMEEMWKMIQVQQKILEAQKQEISRLKNTSQMNEEKIEATSVALEESDKSYSKAKEWFNKTSIGGYGELHYNNWDNKKEGGKDKKEVDLHRFVLFVGHEFNDDLRFFSEFEIEHSLSGDGKNGEVEVEQAYVEYDFNENHSGKAGVFLMPFGILNETHEPPAFYGTERNPVESNIIPSTWWEGGLGISSHFENGVSTDITLTSGLYLTKNKEFKIRNGRQKVSKAKADSGALSGRIK